MKILEHNELVIPASLTATYKKLLAAWASDDLKKFEIKTIPETSFYSVILNAHYEILFQKEERQGEVYFFNLELIKDQDYASSRFFKGGALALSYINPVCLQAVRPRFHVLDKILSFDQTQETIFECPLPLILIGGAGSGKTTLTLEKMKHCAGDVLYVTHSSYLVEHSRGLYYSQNYQNEHQNIDFLSFSELFETVRIPKGQSVDYARFLAWFARHQKALKLENVHAVFEEFRGVLTGSEINKAYLSREDYLSLGIKQSIFTSEERQRVYDAFERYLIFLKTPENNAYDPNILAYEYCADLEAKYDYLVVDEIQDFTSIQIYFLLKLLKSSTAKKNISQNFVFCGDSNQIVHPNFFSWAKIKTLLLEKNSGVQAIQILHTNYRNSYAITEIANRILKIKQQRFGSIDKESNYLVTTQSKNPGEIYALSYQEKIIQELNQLSKRSTKFAILVMKDEDKAWMRTLFQSPLIFSIHEAKGLEYQNIVLVNLISKEHELFKEIAAGVSLDQLLNTDQVYARAKNKNDKSLEAYKFYINSLYVAVTRSVQHLYMIESRVDHPLLALLGLQSFQSKLISQKAEISSIDDWQKEAHKLELQGKKEQAELIRADILKQKSPPWTVLTPERFKDLYAREIDKNPKKISLNKTERLLLLEYALIHEQIDVLNDLKKSNFHPAQNISRALDFIHDKYYVDYGSKNFHKILRQVNDYGVDFKNPFNQTPLSIAVKVVNEVLVKNLIELGADLSYLNNYGLDVLQMFLNQTVMRLSNTKSKQSQPAKMAEVYALLTAHRSSLSLDVDGRLIKIDSHKMEFFLFNLLAGIFSKQGCLVMHRRQNHEIKSSGVLSQTTVTAGDLEQFVNSFDDQIIWPYRKKRAYLSHMLSKNEMFREGSYNNRLFLRLRIGIYIINPNLKIKRAGLWVNFYESLGLDFKLIYPGVDRLLRRP